jgi:hypothetical protein
MDKEMDGYADTCLDRQTDGWMDIQMDEQTDLKGRQLDRQTD